MTGNAIEPSTIHYLLVKLLSDLNLNRTLKKLRKETNCKTLKPKYLPDSLQNLNYKKLIKLCNKYSSAGGFKVVNSGADSVNTVPYETPAYVSDDNNDRITSTDYQEQEPDFENEPVHTNNRYYITGSNKRKDIDQLKTMKGKDFKSQKHKRKRGSWSSSGEITNTVKSIIFDD